MGHEEAFPLLKLSVGEPFSKPTLATTLGNGEDAPSPDLRIPDKLPHSGQQMRETMAGSLMVEEVGSIAVSSGGTYSAGRASTKCLDQAS